MIEKIDKDKYAVYVRDSCGRDLKTCEIEAVRNKKGHVAAMKYNGWTGLRIHDAQREVLSQEARRVYKAVGAGF